MKWGKGEGDWSVCWAELAATMLLLLLRIAAGMRQNQTKPPSSAQHCRHPSDLRACCPQQTCLPVCPSLITSVGGCECQTEFPPPPTSSFSSTDFLSLPKTKQSLIPPFLSNTTYTYVCMCMRIIRSMQLFRNN